jgi:TusE/DsrC/DsvC family sulfur relay protein
MDAKTQEISSQLSELSGQLAELTKQVSYVADKQRERDEFFGEMQPILKDVMHTATGELQRYEDKGYFSFGREALAVVDRVVESYGEDDVRALGDNIVRIMDTVRAFTQPEMLAIAQEATTAIDNADQLEPTGVVGMMRASRDEDVQRGMAVFLAVLRAVGAGIKEIDRPAKAKPKRKRKKVAPVAAVAPKGAAKPKRRKKAKAAAAQPLQIDGVVFDDNGYLADASQWTEELAIAIAASHGLTLSERHWVAIQAVRNDFGENGVSPNIRRLTTISDVSTKELYKLFPKAPGMTLARVAGTPKPVGCI